MTPGRITIFESPSSLAKRWELDSDGRPQKSTAARMCRGSYVVQRFTTAQELAALLDGVTNNQAICTSLPLDGSESGRIVTAKQVGRGLGAKARTKQYFGLMPSPGALFIDSDDGTTRDTLTGKLSEFLPGIDSAGLIWRPSGSSHIHHGQEDLTGLHGQHLFVPLLNAADGPRVVKTLAARFWLASMGRVEVSKSGALLLRCPIDTAPTDAARLIFAGGAETVAPLEQRRGPSVMLSKGGFYDSLALVPNLSPEELGRYEALVQQAKADAMPLAMQRRSEHRETVVTRRVPELMRQGVGAAEAAERVGAAVDAAFGGYLLSDLELEAVHEDGRHEVVTVGRVLADRDRWHEVDILDPLNPGHRGGAPDCRLYLHGTSPIAYSLDDGGTVYRLRSARQRITVAKGARGELVQQLAALVAGLDQVFSTDAGAVLVDGGRVATLTVERLMNLVGLEALLSVHTPKGPAPTDLTRETAALVLAALNT